MRKRDTSITKIFKPCMFCTQFVCLQQAYEIGGEMGRMGPISGLATHAYMRNKLNTAQRLQFIDRETFDFISS